MLNKVLKELYLKIHVAKYFTSLQNLNEIYLNGKTDEYLRKTDSFFSDLLRFPYYYIGTSSINVSNHQLIKSFTTLHGSRVNELYAFNLPLFLTTQEFLILKDANGLISVSDRLHSFLDQLYSIVYARRKKKRSRVNSIFLPGTVGILLFCFSYFPLKERYLEEKEEYNIAANSETYKEKTIRDILALKVALQLYHQDNNSYPKSSGGWDAVNAAFGESKKVWIPGLVPKYIKELPVDPRLSKESIKQYMYKSNGADYKLIAHFPVGIEEVIKNQPPLVDPVRPSWAFGIWSDSAKNW
ncbi:MAG: type II secretion system protein GspG [Flavitalea sp.]